MSDTIKSLSIARTLSENGHQTTFSIDCHPGVITILADDVGADIKFYINALRNVDTASGMNLSLGGNRFKPENAYFVGFGQEDFPNVVIPQYLKDSGVPASEIDRILDKYDLRRSAYLSCSQLPLTQKRQLTMLELFRSTAPLVVLNDPFMPFSGRWREAFAEMLLDDSQAKNRVVVIVGLSFLPQGWDKNEKVQFLDVGREAALALHRLRELHNPQAKEAERKQAEKEAAEKKKAEEAVAKPDKKVEIPIPENLVFAYKEVRDRIFEPLARASTFLRSWSGAVFMTSLASITILMGVIMFPNIAGKWEIVRNLSAKFNISWGDVNKSFEQQAPTNVDLAPEQPPTTQDAEPSEINPVPDTTEPTGEVSTVSETTSDLDSLDSTQEAEASLLIQAQPEVAQEHIDFDINCLFESCDFSKLEIEPVPAELCQIENRTDGLVAGDKANLLGDSEEPRDF